MKVEKELNLAEAELAQSWYEASCYIREQCEEMQLRL
jgi:hypothetical protein